MNKHILLVILLLILKTSFAQDIVKIMQYNLLYYGENTSYCTYVNNNITNKNEYLKKIIDDIKPDIFTVNEITANDLTIEDLMNNCLNVSGRNWYSKAGFTNWAGSNIVNMLYYDNRKFTLYAQDVIEFNSLRDINVYHLYYNSPDITSLLDTAYLTCIVAHLKAGSTQSDEDTRNEMAQAIMQFIDNQNKETNYLLMGDFNTYSASESAMQTFVNYIDATYHFNDPINQLGDWNNNYSYSNYHTQSTHTTSGCAAGGGMDDRFDLILISNYVKNGTDKIQYHQNSYIAFGQDGLRLNQTINSPANTVVSTDIADALYGMSDHLPVIIELDIDQTPALGINSNKLFNFNINFNNPVASILNISIEVEQNTNTSLMIYSLTGKMLMKKELYLISGCNNIHFDINSLSSGMYYLVLKNEKDFITYKKLMKI